MNGRIERKTALQKDQSQKGIAKLASRRANCKVKPFGFLRKIFLSSLRSKRVFSPKNLACRSVYANSFAFLFSFFRFFFFPGQFVRRAAFSAVQRVGTRPTRPFRAPCRFLRSVSLGSWSAFAADPSAVVPLDVGRMVGTRFESRMGNATAEPRRETKSVSRWQSIKKPTTFRPSAHIVEIKHFVKCSVKYSVFCVSKTIFVTFVSELWHFAVMLTKANKNT